MREVSALCFFLLLLGCQSQQWNCNVDYDPREPVVTLESTTETKESPARGFPVLALPLPAYPPDLRRAGVTGAVTVRLTITPDGVVANSSILKSSFREFEASVLSATKSWKFRTLPDAEASDDKRLVIDCQIKFALAAP